MSHASRHAVKHRRRTTFVAGRLRPQRQPRPCDNGWHIGPLLDTARYDIAGGIWAGMGTCAACMSTVHRSQVRVIA